MGLRVDCKSTRGHCNPQGPPTPGSDAHSQASSGSVTSQQVPEAARAPLVPFCLKEQSPSPSHQHHSFLRVTQSACYRRIRLACPPGLLLSRRRMGQLDNPNPVVFHARPAYEQRVRARADDDDEVRRSVKSPLEAPRARSASQPRCRPSFAVLGSRPAGWRGPL